MGACCASCAAGKACESDSVGTIRLYNGVPGLRLQGCYPLSDLLPEGVIITPGQVRAYLLTAGGMGFPVSVAMTAGDIALSLRAKGYGNMATDVLAIVAAFKVSGKGEQVCGRDHSARQYIRWLRQASASGNRAAMMSISFLRDVQKSTGAAWLDIGRVQGKQKGQGIRINGYRKLIQVNP